MPDFDDGLQRVDVELFDDEQLGFGRYFCFLGFVADLADCWLSLFLLCVVCLLPCFSRVNGLLKLDWYKDLIVAVCRAEHVDQLFASNYSWYLRGHSGSWRVWCWFTCAAHRFSTVVSYNCRSPPEEETWKFEIYEVSWPLRGKPLLFLGHVVMMSAAFQVFMLLGLTLARVLTIGLHSPFENSHWLVPLLIRECKSKQKNPFYPSWTCWRILRFRLENKDVFATLPVPPCGQGFFPPHKLLQENWNRFQTRLSNAAQSWRSHFFLNISGLHLLQAISRPNVWCWDWRVHPPCCGISRMVASMFWILGQKMESYRMIWDVRPEMLFRVVIGAYLWHCLCLHLISSWLAQRERAPDRRWTLCHVVFINLDVGM